MVKALVFKARQLVQGIFSGTLSAAKACLLVEKTLGFIAFDKDIQGFEESMQCVEAAYVSDLLSQASYFPGVEDLVEVALIY